MADPDKQASSPGERAISRRDGAVLLLLYLVPLALNAIFIRENGANPFFTNQLSDSRYYLAWAREMSRGAGFGPYPYFVNPLYLLFLTALFKLGLGSVDAIRVVQVLLGSAVYPLAYLVGKRLFGRRGGLIAFVLAIGYGPLLHAVTDLSSAWLESVLILAVVLAFYSGRSVPVLLAGGAAAGLAALCKPVFLPLVFLAPLLLVLESVTGESRELRKGIARALVCMAAFIVVVLPVTVRNFVAGGDLVLIASHGGINFFIGNNAAAQGIFSAPPGFHEDPISCNYRDAKLVAEASAGRPLKSSEVSRFWMDRGIDFLVSSPARALSLYARKVFLSAHSYEIPSSSDYSFFREQSALLRLLPVPFALLLAAGAAGVVLFRHRWRDLLLVYVVLGLQVASLLAFYVSSRYRLPLAPLLAVFAGGAAARGLEVARSRPWRVAAAVAAAAVVAALLGHPYQPIRKIQGDSRACLYEIIGTHYFEQGRIDEAYDALVKSVEIRPAIRQPHWYLARILERRGRYREAATEWLIASRLYGPDSYWGFEARKNYERLERATAGPH